jgi:phage terminase large subunit-like protein
VGANWALKAPEEQAGTLSLVERIALLPRAERRALLKGLKPGEMESLVSDWVMWARPGQVPPPGDWRVWLLMAGRGYGKTRAGAEWVQHLAEEPGLRIALVGPSVDEVRSVMVEGASGILACARGDAPPTWEPSLGVLTWPNGTRAFVYSAAHAEGLRGPEHDHAWCDEIGKWAQATAAWDNLMFGLRRGRFPRVLATTTPRPTALMRALCGRADVAKTGGRTADNVLLAASFVDYVHRLYGGTRLGRQELDGLLIEDVEGTLFPRALIDACRVPAAAGEHEFSRVIVGVDPPASVGGDACGIVVAGLGADGVAYVLADASVRGLRPEGWARAVASAAERWGADRVVVETNQGGDMVESVLRNAGVSSVRAVTAVQGKAARAEPVAALFESGRAKFAGVFAELEDELAGLCAGGRYEGPGRSPDRADACVWALTELTRPRAEPRIMLL